ncbi:hypothetical protein W97_09300 [Coniosporium apollinis CBS 100218]|uniref:SCD domain-containing protein n=1 Tax=Coniosporium apollinis (strain CBS 100218) TaxID=1168221 RepID=R7Z7A0_CONA1|nr:uncharacterized protein W97_09300 [Coniosporium apollinis CBS 100218]EON70032.1 hypothetical protein W97_09300 [Coniosporium apollinis CBS 100218]
MEGSNSDSDAPASTSRRKSGRVVKKPAVLGVSSPTGSTKRKRNDVEEDSDDAEEMAPDASDEDMESSEGEPDEEEIREKRRKAKNRKKGQVKPPVKKAKPNGQTVNLAMRPAPKRARKPKKAKALEGADAEDAGGLYTEVFARGHTLDDVAADWVSQFKKHESSAVADLVNFVLKCAGCDSKVDMHDIEDPDGCTNKLTDLQDEYQSHKVTEYPLIAKGKGATSFKASLKGFFDSLIRTIAASGLLYENIELIENIEVWVSTMSSAANRPFRHTATVVSLAIVSALCDVGKDLVESTAKTLRQSENEQKKGRVNKGRVADLEKKAKQAGKRQEQLDTIIKDWFDTVFVHRYRDVDPRIRVDCVHALSDWILTYPDLFFDGHHLRYLGWVLSDTSAPTRLEVLKQLQRLYKDKDKLAGFKTFTERFRARMVEMATRDAESNVRSSAVELLDILREAGLLEPDDIDSVGRLIFDSEPRVRKAVVGFFAENVNDLYESKIEELGGQEALDEALVPIEGDEDYDSPRIEWLKLKSLVEILQTYDAEDQALPSQIEKVPSAANYVLIAAGIESRFSLAAQALYNLVPEIKRWKVLAGYLLFDNSQATQNGTANDDPETLFKVACKLGGKEEIVLLEVLNAAVKMGLTETMEAGSDKKHKKTKAQKQLLLEEQESAARHLATLIPRLLKKFGALPDAASAVLRLEHVLNLEVFQQLRQDSSTYSALLDDINKQFLTHGSESVLWEASAALLHAKSYEDLGELTEGKVQALWDDTLNALQTLHKGLDFTTRGGLSSNILTAVSNTVLRLSNLVAKFDCIEPFESVPAASRPSQPKQPDSDNAVAILTDIISRGIPTTDIEPETDDQENALVAHAATCLLFYFIWKVRAWQSAIASSTPIPDADLEAVAERRDAFVAALTAVLEQRHGADELRLAVAGTLLDLHSVFVTLRQAKPRAVAAVRRGGEEPNEDYLALILEIPQQAQEVLLHVLAAAERNFAKRAGKGLGDAAGGDEDDADPIASDEEPEGSDDEDNEEGDEARKAEKTHAALMAEQRLCEFAGKLVLGIVAGVVDAGEGEGRIRKRLERNKARLGHNYKEVLGYLDVKEKGGKRAGRTGAKGKARPAAERRDITKPAKSRETVGNEESEAEETRVDDEADEETLRARGLMVEDDDVEDEGADVPDQGGDVESVLGD